MAERKYVKSERDKRLLKRKYPSGPKAGKGIFFNQRFSLLGGSGNAELFQQGFAAFGCCESFDCAGDIETAFG